MLHHFCLYAAHPSGFFVAFYPSNPPQNDHHCFLSLRWDARHVFSNRQFLSVLQNPGGT